MMNPCKQDRQVYLKRISNQIKIRQYFGKKWVVLINEKNIKMTIFNKFYDVVNKTSILYQQLQYLIVSSMNNEEIAKCLDFKELGQENELIRQCLERFPELQLKIGGDQLHQIQGKYKYFLRKYQKFVQEHSKYKQMNDNIDKIVEESNQIKEENCSIDFIKKIMEDTERKYNILKESIDNLRQQKQKTRQEMARLKNILLKIKREFFQMERKQQSISTNMKDTQQNFKKNDIQKTMFKIRLEKKMHRQQVKKVKDICFDKLMLTSEIPDRKISKQFELINQIKEQFLGTIGIRIDQFYKLSENCLLQQSYLNQLVKKRQFKNRDKFLLKNINNYDPQDTAIQVFKLTAKYEHEKEEFMKLSGQQIIDLIIKKNKIGETLQMIEQQKRQIIKIYQLNKHSRKVQ